MASVSVTGGLGLVFCFGLPHEILSVRACNSSKRQSATAKNHQAARPHTGPNICSTLAFTVKIFLVKCKELSSKEVSTRISGGGASSTMSDRVDPAALDRIGYHLVELDAPEWVSACEYDDAHAR